MTLIDETKKRYHNLTKIPMAFRILVIDTETSGLPTQRNASPENTKVWPHIVQIAAILYKCPYEGRPGRVIKRYKATVQPTDWTIDPGSEKVHGISTENAKKTGIPIGDALNTITELAKSANAICCHNVAFDMPVILSEYYRQGVIKTPLDTPIGRLPAICTMEIGKKMCRLLTEGTRKNGDKYLYYKSPKLSEMYEYLFKKDFEGKYHDALADCEATVEILDALVVHHVPFLRVAVPGLFRFNSQVIA